MAALDYERLREATMNTGEDTAVTVNTRALIDKVLARYSSEHTTLRELIQNAADAGASKVTIKFETSPSVNVPAPQTTQEHIRLQHVIKHHSVTRLAVTNNGQPFTTADWARLKSIAEGNPDETKIGAFGVGFYSVFADCDEPFVISGSNTMAFFWKGNALYTRSGRLPSEHKSTVTSFSLPFRNTAVSAGTNPSPVPDLITLCQFLSTSLTFVGLEEIELLLDDVTISSFRKMSSPPQDARISSSFNPSTEGGIMQLSSVSSQTAQIHATWSNIVGWAREPKKIAKVKPLEESKNTGNFMGFLSKLTIRADTKPKQRSVQADADRASSDLVPADTTSGVSNATVFIKVHTLHVSTKVTQSFSQELLRATKKPPPKKTRVSILTTPFDEASASLMTSGGSTGALATTLFSSVLPTHSGRIFIGFPTGQTTGPLCHLSLPSIIPTVERESIDLNAKYVKDWNQELLQVAGIGCRFAFLSEMEALQGRTNHQLDAKGNVSEIVMKAVPEATHIYKQFTFQETTPSSRVGEIMEYGFWNCMRPNSADAVSIPLLSSQGVLPSHKVRITAEKLSFLSQFPVVPEAILSTSHEFLRKLLANGLLSEMTIDDIRLELEARALTEAELIEFLKWCRAKISEKYFTTAEVQSLFKSTVVDRSRSTDAASVILQLSSIKTFLNTARISPDMPVPATNCPFAVSQSFSAPELKSLGWEELQILPWLQFVFRESVAGNIPDFINMIKSPDFASKVLTTVSKAWEQLSPSSKEEVANLFGLNPTMPTTQGLKRPSESYLPSVKGFPNLAIVTLQNLKPKFLSALGVRTTIELSVVFDKLEINAHGKGRAVAPEDWQHEHIIKYFATVLDEIPPQDLERLRNMPFCLAEKDRHNYLWKVSELYAPTEGVQRIRLPIIKLPGPYKPDSQEMKLLRRLGLMPFPSVATLIACLRQTTTSKQPSYKDYVTIMNYLVNNFVTNGYQTADMVQFMKTPYLLSRSQGFPTLYTPIALYSDEQAGLLGVDILQKDLRMHAEKFGVQAHPPALVCANALVARPPKTPLEASRVFAYMAARVSEADREILKTLSDAQIVPLFEAVCLEGSEAGSRKPLDRTHDSQSLPAGWQAILVSMKTPSTVFIGKEREYKSLLTYVDFGEAANLFLLKAGSRHEPTSLELVRIVSDDPGSFLKSLGQEKYLDLLRKFAEHTDDIQHDKRLVQKLSRTPFLLATQDKMPENNEHKRHLLDDDDDDDDQITRQFTLEVASDILINDRVQTFVHFRTQIKIAPQEDTLEKFYVMLGSTPLHKHIRQRTRLGPSLQRQERAEHLRNEIVTRARIFLFDVEQDSPKNIRHDAKWLKAHLNVEEIQHINLETTLDLTGAKAIEARTAHYNTKESILRITQNVDFYDIGQELLPSLLKRHRQNDIMVFERIMSEPLRRLQKKGYNVERILQQQKAQAVVKESERQKAFDEEKARNSLRGGPRKSLEKTAGMPGAFGSDSPDRVQDGIDEGDAFEDIRKAGTNLFNRFRQGFKTLSEQPESTPNTLDQPRDPRKENSWSKDRIESAVRKSRAHNSTTVQSDSQTSTEVDRGTYCDARQAHNLAQANEDTAKAGGIQCFVSRDFDDRTLLTAVRETRDRFSDYLLKLANVFSVQRDAIHIFYDNRSGTIAFNLNGALFFNCFYFYSLHAEWKGHSLGVWDYWFMVFSHELAHNLVKEHSSNHEYLLQEICLAHRARFYELMKVQYT